jgi:hypothetical protein
MNRLTKAIVLASTLAAAYIELSLATTPLFPFLFWFSIALAAAWFVAGRRVHFAGLPVAMFAIYVGPAVYLQVGIRPDYGLEMIWIFPLVGLLMSGRSAWEWSLPQPWRWPLVAWAVVVSVTWPIILLREVDFYWTVIHFDGVYTRATESSPWPRLRTSPTSRWATPSASCGSMRSIDGPARRQCRAWRG